MCATVLYISYTGLLEPLGQSQVYQYLRLLSKDHEIHLLTYEKPSDLAHKQRVTEMKQEMESQGINWHPFRYHKSPSVPATLWDIARGIAFGVYLVKRYDIGIVHARSYIAGAIALTINKVTKTSFIFDMRGFWADERVDAGIWEEHSRLYAFAKGLEKRLLEGADVVVSLTQAGIEAIEAFEHVDTSDTELVMIPTCVNLELFTPDGRDSDDPFAICYLGSVGTWYLFDEVLECFKILREYKSEALLKVITRSDFDDVRSQLRKHDIPNEAISLHELEHGEVPAGLSDVDAGFFFYKPTFSRKGTSPTKLGEFLAMGIPCLTNAGVGDVQDILEENNVGVVIDGFDQESKQAGIERLVELTQDDDIDSRCRAVAENYYSLERGVERYDRLYRELTEDE